MTVDGRDGAGDRRSAFGLSRRRLLAGLGGLGAVGAASGAGTSAYFTDAASFAGNDIGSGEVGILIDGDPAPNGTLSFSVDGIRRGDSRTETYEVAVHDNAARLWLAAECPKSDEHLADALEVNVRVNGESVTVGWRTLAVVLRHLVDGERIDDGCLEVGESLDLEIAWRLPDDVDDSFADTSASLTLRLYTEQCRHVSESAAKHSNPFAGRVCDESERPEECPHCEPFGKADDIDGDLSVGEEIDLVELPPGVGPHSIVITEVEYKDDGDEAVGLAFDLIDEDGDPGPDVCKVAIKGGEDTKPYDVTPPQSVIDEVLRAPENENPSGKLAGISNVVLFVCVDDGLEPEAEQDEQREDEDGEQEDEDTIREDDEDEKGRGPPGNAGSSRPDDPGNSSSQNGNQPSKADEEDR